MALCAANGPRRRRQQLRRVWQERARQFNQTGEPRRGRSFHRVTSSAAITFAALLFMRAYCEARAGKLSGSGGHERKRDRLAHKAQLPPADYQSTAFLPSHPPPTSRKHQKKSHTLIHISSACTTCFSLSPARPQPELLGAPPLGSSALLLPEPISHLHNQEPPFTPTSSHPSCCPDAKRWTSACVNLSLLCSRVVVLARPCAL